MTGQVHTLQPNRLAALAAALGELVSRVEPGEVPLSWAPGLFADAVRIERLGAALVTLFTGPLDRSGAWRREGYRNVAEYITVVTGSTPTAAHARVATSKRLADLPTTTAAVRSGALSATQAELISDAAKVDPEAEDRLLGLAKEGASIGELREECGRRKAAADPDPDKTWERLRAQRRLRQHRDTEGAWRFSGRGTVDDQAQVNAALDDIIDELFARARGDGHHVDRNQLAYDAMVELARRHLAGTHDDEHRADPTPATETEPGGTAATAGAAGAGRRRKRRRSQQTHYLGIIRADITALRRGRVEGDEICEIAGVGPVPVNRAKQLLGDAVLKLVLTKGQEVATVVHLGRSPTTAQRTALMWLMPCCSVLGCNRTVTEIDHREDWALTHETRLDRLDPLCCHHHALKTRYGWALVAGTGKRSMVPPDDPGHPRHSSSTKRPEPRGPDTSGPPTTGRAAGPGRGDGISFRSPALLNRRN